MKLCNYLKMTQIFFSFFFHYYYHYHRNDLFQILSIKKTKNTYTDKKINTEI